MHGLVLVLFKATIIKLLTHIHYIDGSFSKQGGAKHGGNAQLVRKLLEMAIGMHIQGKVV